MTLTQDDIQAVKEALTPVFNTLDPKITLTETRLSHKIAALDAKIANGEKRLEEKMVSERSILQIFLDQQFRQTNGSIESVAQQRQQTHRTLTHVHAKQADPTERVEKLEQHIPAPL